MNEPLPPAGMRRPRSAAPDGKATAKARVDLEIEERIGIILRIGVHASSACLAAGLALSLLAGATAAGSMLMTIGLVMLMGTPVARVAFSVIEYAVRRDWIFFTFTTIVFLELVAGIIAALVFHRKL